MSKTIANVRLWGLAWRLATVFVVALVVGSLCVAWGGRGARQCAVDFPHDGQCGLVAMEGIAFAFFAVPGTLIAGTGFVVWRWRQAGKIAAG